MARLSIIIVTYNSRGEIGACLDALTRHPPEIPHEVVVVDNASADGTVDAIRKGWSAVSVIDAGANLGFAAACNVGIRATAGDLLLLLNPDTVVPPGAIDRLAAVLAGRDDVAIVGPRIVDADGRAELSWGRMVSPPAELWQKLLVAGHSRRLAPVSNLVDRLTRSRREVDWVSGACLLVRRADALAVGLLDERYFMYVEDVDFCAAVRARGRRVLFTPDVEITHLRGRSVASATGRTRTAYRRSQLAFYAKHHPRWVPLLRAYLKMRRALPDTPDSP